MDVKVACSGFGVIIGGCIFKSRLEGSACGLRGYRCRIDVGLWLSRQNMRTATTIDNKFTNSKDRKPSQKTLFEAGFSSAMKPSLEAASFLYVGNRWRNGQTSRPSFHGKSAAHFP